LKHKLELIQACRGIAALLVVLFHVSELSYQKFNQSFLYNLFGFGSAGVNFFFVLSGFIIFFVHSVDIGRPAQLKPFLLKRFVRVYPLYILVTLALLPIYFLFPSLGKGYEQNLGVIIKSLTLYPQEHFPILIVGWSLSYEILFYLLFSLAIALPLRWTKVIALGWFFGTGLLVSLQAITIGSVPYLINFLFSFHNIEFLLGCWSAYWIRQHSINGKLWFAIGILLFAVFGLCQDYKLLSIHPIFAYSIPSALIILGAASIDLYRRVRLHPTLLCLGEASYSIYLIHYPCLSLLLKVAFAAHLERLVGSTITLVLIAVIAVGIGSLTYRYIEKPLTNFLRQRLVMKPKLS
jgi:peptidoglycan/LPS O-acetylase OafA/YrhL